MRASAFVFLGVLALTAAEGGARTFLQTPPPQEWRAFDGAWSAVGRRQTLPTEGARGAATIQLSGSVVLANAAGLSRAFRAEAIGYDDGSRLAGGRAVWTDTRGDRVFSQLRGETLATGRRVAGTITGGTGRYDGISGDWELTWQFVVETEEGEVQGRAADFKGRFRRIETRR
jgi:hypothetical protein